MLDERSDLRRYLAAVGAVGVALALTLMGRSFLEPTPFVLLLVAVLASAWFGGLGPGILASVLSLGCFILFFQGREGAPELDAPYLRRLIVFLLATLLLGAQSNSSRRARADLRFLSEAGKSLASSLEHDDTIKTICRVFVPTLADACLVELFADNGTLRPVGMGQANDDVGKRLQFLVERCGFARAAGGAERVARTGELEHYPRVTAEVLRDIVPDPASREALLGTGVRSLLIVPLRLRDRMIGTVTLYACRRHKFGTAERDLIEELAVRAAVAIDHANHYRAARRMEEELRQRAEELVAADRHKDEFLAVLAHELRGPLSALRTAVEILRGRMPETLPGGTDPVVMTRQIETLGSLVDDLLDVTRIAQGKMSLKKRALNLNEVLAQAVATARPLIDSCGHTLTVGLPVEGILIEGDPVRLGQVFVNLLTNAAKYTDPGGRIWLTVEREVSDKQEVVIRVSDNGLGMEAEFLPRAFDLFAQGKEARYRGQGGLGIGLTLVRQIVEAHKGRISAHSKGRGQGSEFVVRLPSGVAERRAAVESPSSGEMLLHAPLAGAPRRKVLVVDDNVDAVEALATLLRLWGHDVRVAHDGLAALETVKEFLPDVILLDLTLPHLDGHEVARRILQAEWKPKPNLIAVSGNGQDEDYRRCRDSGFDRLLVKPVDPEELERIVRQTRTA
jgi:signal transduction histidine kinase/CheY-like chemotaxis protein